MINRKDAFCTGCGFCKAVEKDVKIKNYKSGYNIYSPSNAFKKMKLCPYYGRSMKMMNSENIWGCNFSIDFTWSSDKEIRTKASSGGTLTSVALFLLDNKIVDGIIHTKQISPKSYELVCSTNKEELIACCGSKYIDTPNLTNIFSLIKEGKKYCFIGKPCEITILKNFSNINKEFSKSIILYLSFFCAGVPNYSSNDVLLRSLGTNINEIISLKWRGDGWPGTFCAKDYSGNEYTSSYENAWSNYLGRNLRPGCRFCIDSIGEIADISAADGWYLKNGKPDFKNKEGRNITFSHTEVGFKVLNEAIKKGYIVAEEINDYDDYLCKSQIYHFQRRAYMASMIFALKCTLKATPSYDTKFLNSYKKRVSYKKRYKRFLGTIKRILNGKI